MPETGGGPGFTTIIGGIVVLVLVVILGLVLGGVIAVPGAETPAPVEVPVPVPVPVPTPAVPAPSVPDPVPSGGEPALEPAEEPQFGPGVLYNIYYENYKVFTRGIREGEKLRIDIDEEAKCGDNDHCAFEIMPVDESRNVFRFRNPTRGTYVGVDKVDDDERLELREDKDCDKERCDFIIDTESGHIYAAGDADLAWRERDDDEVEIDKYKEDRNERFVFRVAAQ